MTTTRMTMSPQNPSPDNRESTAFLSSLIQGKEPHAPDLPLLVLPARVAQRHLLVPVRALPPQVLHALRQRRDLLQLVFVFFCCSQYYSVGLCL